MTKSPASFQNAIAALQTCVANRLDPIAIGDRRIAGVIGEAPSQYSKSPGLWNTAFRHLGIHAIYLPLDVEERRLKEFVSVIRDSERVLGINITVPHKVQIVEYLDELDPAAGRVQAVNTIVRTNAGRLIGYNTDGEGFVESILRPQPGRVESFVKSLTDMNVLLLGAGGSARAVAFALAELLGRGELLICNRTFEHADRLAAEICNIGHDARAVRESELPAWAPRVGLIINSTTKGQGGVRRLQAGQVTGLEFYSALAPAHPTAVPESEYAKPDSQESAAKLFHADIKNNNEASIKLAASVPQQVPFYDLIYFPEETVFLRHARLTGHPTMNGKGILINQAAIAFCKRICRAELLAKGIDDPETYREVLRVMYSAW
jgi:shikimate dehydrogenase